MTNYKAPTISTMETLQTAYDHFNEKLFAGELPPVMITLNRKRNARGYFHAEQFRHRDDDSPMHEIAITPDTMNTGARGGARLG
jgi:hypothetical protein